MSSRRGGTPGEQATPPAGQQPLPLQGIRADRGTPWDQYIHRPKLERLGICCSGGGIRSAAYNLGVLQVLREKCVLDQAEYLAAVSGGAYTAVAHTVLVSATLDPTNRAPLEGLGLSDQGKEAAFFGIQGPWAAGSPEERYLRDHSSYLASGLGGWIWLLANLLYGLIRHLLPFAAGLFVVGTAIGLGLSRWLGDYLRREDVRSIRGEFLRDDVLASIGWLLVAVSVIAFALLVARQFEQERTALTSFGSTRCRIGLTSAST